MKQSSTVFLKLALAVMGLIALAICVFALPALLREAEGVEPVFAYPVYGIVVGLYVTAIPFLIALYQAYRLLRYIELNTAFSDRSVVALKNIKYSALAITIIYGAFITPFLFVLAEADDAPGIILVGMIMAGASFVVAVFAAVLQRLVRHAIDIQSENDLTV